VISKYHKPSAESVAAHDALIKHLMSGEAKRSNCCCAPVRRYCEIGSVLVEALHSIHENENSSRSKK
jgi:hypothetical protein